MIRLAIVETSTGATVGTIAATDDGVEFFDAPGWDLFRSAQSANGWDDDRTFDALASGWTADGFAAELDEALLDELSRAEGLDEDDEILRAMGGNRYKLREYWTHGAGLKRWIKSRHQWTTLYRLLRRHVGSARAKRMASQWLHSVTGLWAGSDAHRVAQGGKPRGKLIGPG
jgi:hypothetical protein